MRTPRSLVPVVAPAAPIVRRLRRLRVDEGVAREVAEAYLDAPATVPSQVRCAYEHLQRETDTLFAHLTARSEPNAVRVEFTRCGNPYDHAGELIASIRTERLLEVVTSVAGDRRAHQILDSSIGGAFDRFRAVHDLLGHGRLAVGFDRHSEYATWRFQELFHTEHARRALAAELHAKHSVLWTTGEVADDRAVVLDDELIAQARRGRSHEESRR